MNLKVLGDDIVRGYHNMVDKEEFYMFEDYSWDGMGIKRKRDNTVLHQYYLKLSPSWLEDKVRAKP